MGVSCSWWREMPVSGSEIVRGPGGGKDWTVPLSTVREGDGSPFLSRRGLFLVRGDVPGDKVSDELKGESLVTSSRSSCRQVRRGGEEGEGKGEGGEGRGRGRRGEGERGGGEGGEGRGRERKGGKGEGMLEPIPN